MRNRTLTALLVAEVVSSTGSAMTFVALPWFVLVTSTPARMSFVLAAEILPMALFGIPSGAVVARLGSRVSMLISDAVRAPLIALLPVLYWAGALNFGWLLAIAFLMGVFITPYISAQRTIIPELFGDDETLVAKASGLFGAAAQAPIIIGPILARRPSCSPSWSSCCSCAAARPCPRTTRARGCSRACATSRATGCSAR